MNNNQVKKVVIAGGGTAGWLAAAALSKQLGSLLEIELVESDAIGTVGVGESTIPTICSFHALLGIDEAEFMRATQATFKLGIEFANWGRDGDRYVHGFGHLGKANWMGEFHQFWLHARSLGFGGELGDYCLETQALNSRKFATSEKPMLNYAYHLDATRYAQYLRGHCEARGVVRSEGKIREVRTNAADGFIESLVLECGKQVRGDLFIDCTGFRALLMEEILQCGFEDWNQWLPTDRAYAVQSELAGPARPNTRAIARSAGWRWQIPLQSRMGNGMVFCGDYQSDDEALAQFLAEIDGEPLFDPRLIRYRAGRRKKAWEKNCIALGLSSGFVEPLESTSIHLIMIGITRLMQLFPFDGIVPSLQQRFNQQSRDELEKVRDFVVLHYKLTEREDSEFWRYCKHMSVPDSLAERIALFRESAQVHRNADELFRTDSWVQVMLGQHLYPQTYHPMGRLMSEPQLRQALAGLQGNIRNAVARLPEHQVFIDRYCKAAPANNTAMNKPETAAL
ncbi:tryptophan 7-halogenase [Microbulbifer bruguierae]|uniref:Tryptophan 7-halogenase n=1 Tax=Microbulbifer bruguierae TaxID=3029061 RepID=A0ABY8NJU4_9GAMM|nr:tryptophan 7-halogenase [Microbulbifer bruguierae]WGL18352.1 tryptophan 7-halogenase [Microbulbifer bruguierae]